MKLGQTPILRTLPVFYAQATATKLRRVVFSLLALWAVLDAVLTFRDWRNGGLSLALSTFGLVGSFCLSMLFIGLVALIWDWLARRFGRRVN